MAPRPSPRKPRAAGDYSAVGTRGRRTGTTLRQGKRGSDGMEELPTFSSPQKATTQVNGTADEESANAATYTADDSMDIDQSIAPEPTDVVRDTRKSTRLSLPRAMSPIKSPMRGTPRRPPSRAPAPPSESPQPSDPAPSHISPSQPEVSSPAVGTPRSAGLKRPKKGRPSKKLPPRKNRTKGPFDLNVSDDENSNDTIDPSLIPTPIEDPAAQLIDDSLRYNEPSVNAESDQAVEGQAEDTEVPDDTIESVQPPPFPAGKSMRNEVEDEKPTKRRGRPPAKKKAAGQQRAASEVPKANAKRKAPLSEQDPNTKLKKAPKLQKPTPAPPSRAGSVQPVSGFMRRSETPATDDGAQTTRSGRTSIKPIAYWRGENVVFGERRSRESLPGIVEVVRTEEMPPPPRKRAVGARRGGRRRGGTAQPEDYDEEEEDEEELAAWEIEPGVHYAQAMAWDHASEKYDEFVTDQVEIAYSANAIKLKDIASSTFKFAKTLTIPFFGSGMVHLPPGGEKRVKNSRKMQMVFFVFTGRCTVNVGTPTVTFSIGRGGQWQVPRGNFYSMINESETKDCKIFFAQGCQWGGDAEAAGMEALAPRMTGGEVPAVAG